MNATAPLSADLRASTAQAHAAAEHSPFVERLMAGSGTSSDFALLTAQLHPVYEALEDAVDRHLSSPVVATMHDPALARTASLSADLSALFGPDVLQQRDTGRIPTVPATRAYVDRLRALDRPEAVIAHHYVRYLGDLSGGQIIARLVERHYDIPAAALSFYRFDGITKPKTYKDAYRARLDALALDGEGRAIAVSEAIVAFRLNQAIFADLESHRAAPVPVR